MAQPSEVERSYLRLLKPIRSGVKIEYEALNEMIRAANVDPTEEPRKVSKRLQPKAEEMAQWAYDFIASTSIEHETTPVLVFLPQTKRSFEPGEIDYLTEMGRRAGFTHTISLEEVYDSTDIESILLAPWDYHPNVRGHEIIGSYFYETFSESLLAKEIRGIQLTAASDPVK